MNVLSAPTWPYMSHGTYIRLHVVGGRGGTHTLIHVGFLLTFNYICFHLNTFVYFVLLAPTLSYIVVESLTFTYSVVESPTTGYT